MNLIFLFATFALTLSALKNEDVETVRQCTCKELDDCLQNETAKFEPCSDKCLHRLVEESPQFKDKEEQGKQCFQWDNKGHNHCYEEIKESICTLLEDHKIPLNSTIEFFHQLSDEKNDSGGDSKSEFQQTVHIINQVKISFGQDGHNFADCVKHCFTSRPGTCTDGLGCGVKRPSLEQWKNGAEKCKKKKIVVRKQFCDCLTAAGIGYFC